MLQPQALASLKQEYDTAYANIMQKTETLEAFKGDYKDLKKRLKTLPDKLEYDALVPMGTKAMGYGKVIHTNEILCMLGDNYFMECSAKTACEIVDRRIKKCDQHLEEQKQEADRLEHWKNSLTKLIVESLENDSLEIVEEVTDEDYERMALEHLQSVRRHHENVAKDREKKSAEQTKAEEDEFWARLDELELEEEMMQAEASYKKRQLKSAQKVPSPPLAPAPTTSSIKTKPKITKHVQFNNIPEIREIPSLAETKALTSMRYSDVVRTSTSQVIDIDDKPPKKPPPTHHVEGLGASVLERSQPMHPLDSLFLVEPSSTPVSFSTPGTSTSHEIFSVENQSASAQPAKKASLFKQRRGANL